MAAQSRFRAGAGGQHPLSGLVDHEETYGRHVLMRFARGLPDVRTIVDLGAGLGFDLRNVHSVHPAARKIAIEANPFYAAQIEFADQVEILNIERDSMPFVPGSIDLILANQVLEHTKEVFWIFDQVFRSLRVGGHFIFGVPNVASLHNRLLLLAGIHPTQHKLCSAHVRPFSRRDTEKFLAACFPGCSIVDFAGSQFYPLPKTLARASAWLFPTMAFSIFFMVRKDLEYDGEFAAYPARASFETNYWTGLEVGHS